MQPVNLRVIKSLSGLRDLQCSYNLHINFSNPATATHLFRNLKSPITQSTIPRPVRKLVFSADRTSLQLGGFMSANCGSKTPSILTWRLLCPGVVSGRVAGNVNHSAP
ncbi:uncharacterized protein APUU_11510A [Aspergillus puulaauensis]|uniref:Uncharacterized protein n=1 Tax=Aspergillus puulaauensis TaxID=1220207 RepID=A0A7R7XC34_9EURO|nr:uncharacterized protein APUU_11510A [Aspergillus puulaauensis]BCS18682.1 hypothetical protein APUU_11510A [Aspergillus puulaauensis]